VRPRLRGEWYRFSRSSGACQLAPAPAAFYVPAVDEFDPPSPRAVVRGILGVAMVAVAVGVAVAFFATGAVAWKGVALLAALWGAWGFLGGLFDMLVAPLGRFLGSALGGGVPPPPGATGLTQETAMLERLLAAGSLERHHEILVGVRLAEIYRLHQRDAAKAEALIARLEGKYPNAPELKYARLR